MSALSYTLIFINVEERENPRGHATCVSVTCVCLSRCSVSPEHPAGQENSAVKCEANATRAFSLNASD